MFNVVVVLECPSVDATVVISVPLLISKLAFRCLKLCNETSGKSFFSAVRLYQFENVEEFIGTNLSVVNILVSSFHLSLIHI